MLYTVRKAPQQPEISHGAGSDTRDGCLFERRPHEVMLRAGKKKKEGIINTQINASFAFQFPSVVE